MPRPRPKALTLTDAAAERMREIMAAADDAFIGVKIGVKNGGCAGMEYTMDYATDRAPLDEVVEDRGITILIDPKAILFLLGTEVDYVTEKLSSRFVFNNPNQTDACGCGESVTIVPARNEA
ncbi:HesB/YadR/YfhF [Parvularcula bermudensis HTCC2503]|uniref:HesB/YadR/YfhF n=1 Tax=Parvularcula bermudensis (strain ATCC BAA-594 / HTCC2503 / KCTC 12087) TaxID=314260 RepID=E0TEF3_PARBH|nr:iron-sulfur cluster assembly accessory protein [Parvularcula bermudensis]ADM10039.1 HesB/YadR/YfhF [Parvularcula bermudensis HTCC2503]